MTPDDEVKHGPPITINPKDMVTFPKGWSGKWTVHSFLAKRYAFFDSKGIRKFETSMQLSEWVNGRTYEMRSFWSLHRSRLC